MLSKIIAYSVKNKLIVVLFTLTIVGAGFYSIMNIPIGAVPDITNNQVQVITTSSNLSTQEIEQFITAPVELEMANLPGVEEIRSVSKFGLSVVTIVFKDEMGTFLPRQLIAEKIKSATSNIPQGFGEPEMGPISTGLGEIYQYVLDLKPGYEERYSAMELRTIQDWIVARQLSGIEGVVEVNSWGGYLKQFEIAVNPTQLASLGLTLMDVFNALEANNSISGASYIEKTNQSYFIRGDGLVKSVDDIKQIVVTTHKGVPILINHIAEVRLGHANRYGAITANGTGEKVLGQIMMLKDANSKEVIKAVKQRVTEVQSSLPEGVFINPVLERSELINKTTLTVIENLVFGCIIVILIVFLILGNLRSALVIGSMIPLSLLFTLSMMYIFGVDANLMSLGALDFGIIIDGAVIIVEFIVIQVTGKKAVFENGESSGRQSLMDELTNKGASKMMNSAIFGQVIILIVFIPILALTGVEGKMFRPMALSFSFAIIGAMLLGLTWLPVAASLFLKPEKTKKNKLTTFLMSAAYRTYEPVINWACGHKKLILGMAFLALVGTGVLFGQMGGEFVPTLDEGDFVIQPVLKTGTSLSKTIEMTTRMEQILMEKFPEVNQIVCRIGAAEVPTDPMSMEEIDMIIKLHPKSNWSSADTKEELADKFKEALSIIPGVEYEFTQPIEMRFNELITGVRADIAIKIFGEDLNYLDTKANEIKRLIEDVPGAADIILEKTVGLPQMSVVYNRNKIAYYGADIATLNRYLTMGFGGESTGVVFDGEKRFDMVVRLSPQNRQELADIEKLMVPLNNGKLVPLKELATISVGQGPAKISRENASRRVVVSVNVRNRDLKSVVADIENLIDEYVSLQPGYYIQFGGQFENLKNATQRLFIAVPLALALIFIFLHFAFNSLRDALLIFTAVPLSTVGGVVALWLRDMPFSVSAGIGFIALFGIAVLNGIVLIEHLKELKLNGNTSDIRTLIIMGTKDRLRPVMLTASAAAMGFLPMAISSGAGAEVQRPLATVVIGGLVTSTLLTMVALPLLFELFYNVKRIAMFPFRIIRNGTSVLLLVTLATTSLMAQDKEKNEVSLQMAIDLAIENNKQLSAYRLRIDESKQLASTAYDIDKTQLYYDRDENNIAANGHPLYVLGVEQSFRFPTVYGVQKKANNIETQLVEKEYEKQFLQLTKEVTQAYYAVVYYQNKRQVLLRVDSVYANFSSNAKARFAQGDIGNVEKLNALAKHQRVSLLLKQINYDLAVAETQLSDLVMIDSALYVPFQALPTLQIKAYRPEQSMVLAGIVQQQQHQNAMLRVERHKLLPDLSIGYYSGTNNYADAGQYSGVYVGVSIPLFFGGQKARINARKIGLDINEKMQEYYRRNLASRYKNLLTELLKYQESITFFEETGRELSLTMIKTAQRSYELGEMDAMQFIMTMENALELVQDYYENIYQYNHLVLEINYLQ
ncbi:CusA/CzcA family heavy metal efflux RND transporter [Carboxylicivirga sp. A043]|uniref:CusA/CzcA family heavy metal efflux RND transporter n=1 Tax=Carboxylicivirga litoralis TaxID=2816963 RepID=UPI0021CB5738|nr:CusA/CzcA family heavy metal efflux RND transporter [Carboxylicivirga sp. A043]MCU4157214.1 CusA/CzcA family heavy metal efflux RND transporter [Carboxylicivirga sp. A043]